VAKRLEFGEFLEGLLAAREMSARVFALKVRKNPTYLSKVMRGEVPMSAKHVESWADVLGLVGKEREEWLEKAWSTRTPPYILDLLTAARKQAASRRR
jgi:transcriptional regulator with XRE-family HTH domain